MSESTVSLWSKAIYTQFRQFLVIGTGFLCVHVQSMLHVDDYDCETAREE